MLASTRKLVPGSCRDDLCAQWKIIQAAEHTELTQSAARCRTTCSECHQILNCALSGLADQHAQQRDIIICSKSWQINMIGGDRR